MCIRDSICKQIVGHFNHSPQAISKYEEYQTRFNLPQHRFIQDIQTRCNSQYHMLSKIFEQKTALISYCSDHSKPVCLETMESSCTVSYTHLRAHETPEHL